MDDRKGVISILQADMLDKWLSVFYDTIYQVLDIVRMYSYWNTPFIYGMQEIKS